MDVLVRIFEFLVLVVATRKTVGAEESFVGVRVDTVFRAQVNRHEGTGLHFGRNDGQRRVVEVDICLIGRPEHIAVGAEANPGTKIEVSERRRLSTCLGPNHNGVGDELLSLNTRYRDAGVVREPWIQVLIAGAGAAAHLAGVVAAETTLPVIGVPIGSSPLQGFDSLLSTAQMPGGVSVATMAIGKAGAKNAGLLAVQILALGDAKLTQKLDQYKKDMAKQVEAKNRKLQSAHG
ncbi:MAG: AIR carboxylase family protein [Proteobacteria bacterium]|nr:AIR carboxylase family protein [Pseudomonadota bacterium]